jgi:hypothetical protein
MAGSYNQPGDQYNVMWRLMAMAAKCACGANRKRGWRRRWQLSEWLAKAEKLAAVISGSNGS